MTQVNVTQIANRLKADESVKGLVSADILKRAKQIRDGGIDSNEYADLQKFRKMVGTNRGIRAGFFAPDASGFTKALVNRRARAAALILAYYKAGDRETAAALLKSIFGEVAKAEIPKLGLSGKGN